MQAPGRGTHLDIHTDSASQGASHCQTFAQSSDHARQLLNQSLSDADSDQPLWLTIGIPTVPRHNHTDYLTLTLRYLMAELPSDPADPIFGKVKVLVMNNLPGQHPVFDKVLQDVQLGASDKRNTFARKAKQYVEFVDNQGTVEDPTPDDRPEPDDLNNPLDIPGRFGFLCQLQVAGLPHHCAQLSHFT